MLIIRKGKHPKFIYEDSTGSPVKRKDIIEYITSLVIPPKYTDVKIHVSIKNGKPGAPDKLTYTGVDDKGRTQYGYSKKWKDRAKKCKYNDLSIFGAALPQIRSAVNILLKNKDASKTPNINVNIAMIMSIVMSCNFRLGNIKYRDMYKSYGITNIEVRHVKIKGDGVAKISFIGKKGVLNECVISDKLIIAHLKNMTAGKNARNPVFTYDGGNDCTEIVKANDINKWMRQFDANITSKMFRTFSTNIMLIELLKLLDSPDGISMAARKKQLNAVLDEVSGAVHNTRAVCKKEYAHPGLIDMYLNKPRQFKNKFMSSIDAEPAFLSYLRAK